MATVKLGENEFHTSGNLPKVGDKAPDFKLTTVNLETKTLDDYKGSRVILNIFPSIDTSVCATSVRTFDKEVAALENTKLLCISHDLPFALSRFSKDEGLENLEALSDFREGSFGKAYGLDLLDGPMQKLHSRVVVVLDEEGTVIHTEQVPNIADQPKYSKVLDLLGNA
ncbi:thiol peroxidase [Kordia jejudonensis]|uniref:thiol peroxidase n=1 Tax=Kordia jejudonensis TaxID=1348245 RepID=UPI0006296FFD|nr:thiol peroxidase [Kordia jejudonensis]